MEGICQPSRALYIQKVVSLCYCQCQACPGEEAGVSGRLVPQLPAAPASLPLPSPRPGEARLRGWLLRVELQRVFTPAQLVLLL